MTELAFLRRPRVRHRTGSPRFLQRYELLRSSPRYADISEVTVHARAAGSGIQPLIDAITQQGGDAGDLRSAVWQATWARGYDDVVVPSPNARLREDGFLVYARPIDASSYAAIIDTAKALWAIIAHGPLPGLGSRLRVAPIVHEGEMYWNVSVIEALGLGFRVTFTHKPRESITWLDRLSAAIARIGDAEVRRRATIVAERRTLITAQPVKPFREELEALQHELAKRVDLETAATPQERAAFARASEKARKAILDDYKARRLAYYNEELDKLKLRIPELALDNERRCAAMAETHKLVAELEDAASRSRGVTVRLGLIETQIAALRESTLQVFADDATIDAVGSSDFEELARTVNLLVDLIPRRAVKR